MLLNPSFSKQYQMVCAAHFLFCSLLLLSLLLSTAYAAAEYYNDATWAQTCKAYKGIPFPTRDRPTAKEQSTLRNCDAAADYYGINKQTNFVAARKCAYAQREANNTEAFAGSSLLMMIYANGTGVKQNLPLATHFACELTDAAEAEMIGRIGRLVHYQKSHWHGHDFDLCTDITSGRMMGECSAIAAQLADAARNEKLRKLTATWHPSDRRALAKLQTIAKAYFETSASNEVDLSGTARGAMSIAAENALKDSFYTLLYKLEHGTLPSATNSSYLKADAQLNAIYRGLPKASKGNLGTVTVTGIRTTELKWLAYRDAWVIFARHKYPNVSRTRLLTYLTLERTNILKNVF